MMARRGVMGLLAGAATLVLGGCGLFGGNSYRFRMTVEVETPQGLRTGSSVYEVEARGGRDLITGGKTSQAELRGEAVVVDLPGGQALFALLKTQNPLRPDLPDMSMKALDPSYRNDRKDSARRIASGDGIVSPVEIAVEDYPLLVTFRDIVDPASVEQVNPANLAATFGLGVRLSRIRIEVTNEQVTVGISGRFEWWEAYRRLHFDSSSRRFRDLTTENLASRMSIGLFSIGLDQ